MKKVLFGVLALLLITSLYLLVFAIVVGFLILFEGTYPALFVGLFLILIISWPTYQLYQVLNGN